MNIKDIITSPAGIIGMVIIVVILVIFFCMFSDVNKLKNKLKNTKNIIKLITYRAIDDNDEYTNEEKIETIKNDFPIMVQEIKDVYDNKKFKQISAIDIFENHLKIPQDKELKIKNTISSFTALGLLGTFIGLMLSVISIDTEVETATIIQNLVGAIGPAIVTSIVGVFFSLIASAIYTKTKADYKLIANKLAEEMMLERPSDTNPDYFYDSFATLTGQKYEEKLKVIVDKFLEQMKESLTQDLKDYRDAINDAKSSLLENEQKFIQAAGNLEGTVSNINQYLQQTDELNKNFETKLKEFATALEEFNATFENTNTNTATTISNIQDLNDQNLKMNQKTYDTLKDGLDEVKKSFETIRDININFQSQILQTPSQFNEAMITACKTINEATEKLNKTPEKLENSIDNICNKIDTLTTKVDKKTTKAINDITNKIDEYTENNRK